MKYVPYDELGDIPNIIVDGAAQDATVLALSHWPKSGTPKALLRDTSAEIVFAYLETPEYHVDVAAASNNHFDEDGLIGLHILTSPAAAQKYRALLIDSAQAGDFGVYSDSRAARICFTIAAYADPEHSPLDASIFRQAYPAKVAALYRELLERLPDIVADTGAYQDYWQEPEQLLLNTERGLADGYITIEEQPDLDLAVVRIPAELLPASEDGAGVDFDRFCHPYAIYTATRRNRVLLLCGQARELRYRYESWVQMITCRPQPRVDLAPLAAELNEGENSGGTWTADGVEQITPVVHLDGAAGSTLPEAVFIETVRRHLAAGPPAWDPY